MSEQTTPVRTDELAPGDRVWHPFDAVCFTVSHTPRPETGLHFEGEPGLRVTGTSDRGETVHVDVAPGYKWYRGPGVVAPSSAPKAPAPLVVNTADGACWTRRAVTEGGVALYALADVCSCPEFVMATFEELAARGIVGSAFALPMPGGPEPEPKPRTMLDHGRDALRARMTKDDLRLVLENVITYAASLEAERHRTNEWADDAAEALRRDRDRIAELEALAGAVTEYRLDEPGYGLLVRCAPGPDRSGWAVLESRRTERGRRVWTSAGWQYSALLSAEELFCWPSAEVAVAEARRVMPGAVVRDEDDVTPQVERLRTLLAGQREQAGDAS